MDILISSVYLLLKNKTKSNFVIISVEVLRCPNSVAPFGLSWVVHRRSCPSGGRGRREPWERWQRSVQASNARHKDLAGTGICQTPPGPSPSPERCRSAAPWLAAAPGRAVGPGVPWEAREQSKKEANSGRERQAEARRVDVRPRAG